MLKRIGFAVIGLGLVLGAAAEMREWTSADGGQKFSGEVIRVVGSDVELKNASGRKVTVPIARLSEADQEYLAARVEAAAAAEKERLAVQRKVDLPHKQGTVVGPIVVDSSASYFLYLPSTLVNTRKAPLLFNSHSGGGRGDRIGQYARLAEINGWVLAISVESSNHHKGSNLAVCEAAVEHILKTLPVDEDRLYFTGESGGGAQSFKNGAAMDACGLMPVIGYIPNGTPVPRVDCFIINGGQDYNRYTSAEARKEIGDYAVHRFFPGGHAGSPPWLMEEGMLWLECRHLERSKRKSTEERAEFLARFLPYLGVLKETAPYRAYYWALYLSENLTLSKAEEAAVAALLTELGADQKNVLYVEGLEEIDELSRKKLSGFGGGSRHDHSDSNVVSKCRSLLKKYQGVPVIEDTLRSIMKPSV